MQFDINKLGEILGAEVKQSAAPVKVTEVSIDTRTIKEGDLYFAIRGAHFDGNEFVADAIAKGAVGVVVDRDVDVPLPGWCFRVEDGVTALGALAAEHRKTLKAPCVAITGSNGKSTTKEMISAIAVQKGSVIKTEGNLNNLIGCPLTILRWNETHNVAVIEMGMNAPGEIEKLTKIANPNVGVITNVNPAHLEFLHSVENVAKAKGELFQTMREDATVIINKEDPWATLIGEKYSGRKITFGMTNGVDVQFGHMISQGLANMEMTCLIAGSEYSLKLPVAGTHNVMNALCAIATGMALGITVDSAIKRLHEFKPMKMRMERVVLANGVHVVNDTYNANPESVKAALRTVGGLKRAGRFIAVLGDMLELGESSAALHKEVGESAGANGVDILMMTGEFAPSIAEGGTSKNIKDARVLGSVDEINAALLALAAPGDVILVKGSRGTKMERVVEFLKREIGV